MKVVIASEFAGYPLKQIVKDYLISSGHDVTDVGQVDENKKMLYPEASKNLAKAIQTGKYDKGIVICGSGAGVSIVCNKFKGVYAVACESMFTAKGIPQINNANVLAMGNNVVGSKNACAMVDLFLERYFAYGESEERKEFLTGMLNSVKEIEKENFKD